MSISFSDGGKEYRMITRAAKFAEQAHKGMFRKGTSIPYITHPLETALITAMMTDDEELIAAALLHDTVEDAGVTYEELQEQFGVRVARLVAEESEDKSKSWMERKGCTLEYLKSADRDAKLLTLADKLSNIRSMARDYILVGEGLWERFNVRQKELHAWYYISMIDLLKDLNAMPEYQEYVTLCRRVFGEGKDESIRELSG
jgi:guanosine-3',5'-bis(diphosphate) 3'-pyrophosphohydrolase